MPLIPEGLTLSEQIHWVLAEAVLVGFGLLYLLWKIACFIAPFAIIWFIIKYIKNNKPR